MTIRTGILFDLDGTLVDTRSVITEVLKETFREMGITVPTETQLNAVLSKPIEQIFSAFVTDFEIQKCHSFYAERICAELPNKAKVFCGVAELLSLIRAQGLKLGIITTRGRRSTKIVLDSFGLNPMDVVITADDVKKNKPSPEPLLMAAQKLSLHPSDCVYIGDSATDIIAAKRAGMAAIGVLNKQQKRQILESEGPDSIVDDVGDLAFKIEEIIS